MGDWVKMRTDLYRDPKVILMADFLSDPQGKLASFVNQNLQRDMTITRNVMRNVTVGALVTVWGIARHQGHRKNDDLCIDGITISVLDDISDLPGFGAAMESVGWVKETSQGLCFPRFFEEHNSDPNEDFKEKNRERQRRYRERNSNVKRDVTVTSQSNARVEKSREEKRVKKPLTPLAKPSPELDTPEFGDAWTEWERHRREKGKKITPTAVTRQMKLLAEMGVVRAIAAIHFSIAQGYTGIFEPNSRDKSPAESGADEWLRSKNLPPA